jgi:hypothetical protein
MEDELLRFLYHRLVGSASGAGLRRGKFSDGVIVLIFLLGVLQGRSPRWAADRRNWPLWLRRVLPLPSYSQLMRRLRSDSVQQTIHQINAELRDSLPRSQLKFCDGKPLVVGGFSKDPDARYGKVPDGWARGYKVHALVDSLGAIEAFEVTGLDAGESTVARRLVRQTNLNAAVIRADANYDSNALYATVNQCGGRLIAPRRKPGRGLGHHPQHPDRLRAIAELEADRATMRAHRRMRAGVEQRFAHLTNLPFGLSPLPNFVRRQRRVNLWVQGKITLYHLYLNLCQLKMKAA